MKRIAAALIVLAAIVGSASAAGANPNWFIAPVENPIHYGEPLHFTFDGKGLHPAAIVWCQQQLPTANDGWSIFYSEKKPAVGTFVIVENYFGGYHLDPTRTAECTAQLIRGNGMAIDATVNFTVYPNP